MKPAFILAVCALAIGACEEGARMVPVEALMQDTELLKEMRARCKADHARVGDAQCNAVAEATRRRFFGEGKLPSAQMPTPASSSMHADVPLDAPVTGEKD